MQAPDKRDQILQTHASLIISVVQTIHHPEHIPALEQALMQSEANGWGTLVAAIRKIVAGNRDASMLHGLDEEDQIIIDAILKGLQDPATLPQLQHKPEAAMAAPMLAQLIYGAGHGNHEALMMLANMTEQMSNQGGDMMKLGAIIKNMIDGERDADKLCTRMGPQGESLINQLLSELAKLEVH